VTDPQRALVALERAAAEVPVLLAGTDLAAPVPSCPGWSVGGLVAHLGETHLWAERCVRLGDPHRPPTVPSWPSGTAAVPTGS
jgi:hypothetical protein